MNNKKSQIWVETVIYTLIGLTILGLILGLAKPKIEALKDKANIEQGIDMLDNIDQVINDIKYVAGNTRVISIKIRTGEFLINGNDDSIEYLIKDSKYKYSEPGKEIGLGEIKVLTIEKGKNYEVSLKIDYSNNLNISWEDKDEIKIIQASPQPNSISISNKGYFNNFVNIDFS